jgi:hypothetical protein
VQISQVTAADTSVAYDGMPSMAVEQSGLMVFTLTDTSTVRDIQIKLKYQFKDNTGFQNGDNFREDIVGSITIHVVASNPCGSETVTISTPSRAYPKATSGTAELITLLDIFGISTSSNTDCPINQIFMKTQETDQITSYTSTETLSVTKTTPSKITRYIRVASKGQVYSALTAVSMTVCGSEVVGYATGVTAASDPIVVVVSNPAGLTAA